MLRTHVSTPIPELSQPMCSICSHPLHGFLPQMPNILLLLSSPYFPCPTSKPPQSSVSSVRCRPFHGLTGRTVQICLADALSGDLLLIIFLSPPYFYFFFLLCNDIIFSYCAMILYVSHYREHGGDWCTRDQITEKCQLGTDSV